MALLILLPEQFGYVPKVCIENDLENSFMLNVLGIEKFTTNDKATILKLGVGNCNICKKTDDHCVVLEDGEEISIRPKYIFNFNSIEVSSLTLKQVADCTANQIANTDIYDLLSDFYPKQYIAKYYG